MREKIKVPNPFAKEQLVVCHLCGRSERIEPEVASNWRCITNGRDKTFFFCPMEFPPDWASASEFKRAYQRVFKAVLAGLVALMLAGCRPDKPDDPPTRYVPRKPLWHPIHWRGH